MTTERIGILGTGDVGRVLGKGLAGIGHDVRIGSREPDSAKLREWKAAVGKNGSSGSFAEAASHGETVILATLWTGTESAIRLAGGAAAFGGKIVLDATNPLDFSTGRPRLSISGQDSAGEQVQRWLPGARVVKAFNCIGNAHMVKPSFPGGPPDMFIAGEDTQAKVRVGALCAELGFGVVDAGGIEASRYLEALAMLWIEYGIRNKSFNHAFKLLRK